MQGTDNAECTAGGSTSSQLYPLVHNRVLKEHFKVSELLDSGIEH